MYGNYINSPFMMSGFPNNMINSGPIFNNMMHSPAFMNNQVARGGLSSLLGLGGNKGASTLLRGTSSFNFGSLLNNASKALGVVNQAIPIVKEVGPMMGNMKQILKIASVFKDETDTTTRNTTITNDITPKENTNIVNDNITNIPNNNEPNFFL